VDTVLIVEDSKMFAGLVSKKITKEFQFKSIVKENLASTVSFLEETSQKILIAILDLNLPDAPNGEIVDYISSKNIPAIVMTSQVNDEIRDKIFNLGPIDYIIKDPNSLDVLSKTIQRYLRNLNFEILLVDDSSLSRELTKDLLVSQYFSVTEAENGSQALKILQGNSSVKLLITDYHMPVMDGFELIQQLRTQYSMEDLAIIGVSARGNPLLAAQFLKYGANDFITKPFFAEELLWRVNQNIEMLGHIDKIRMYQNELEKEVQIQTEEIKKSQAMILQQEKLAAVGQLSAGIAHEINNPIGFISSNLGTLKNYMNKITAFIEAGSSTTDENQIKALRKKLKIDFILGDIEDLINESTEGVNRVKDIVINLKNFSRAGEKETQDANINDCLESTLKIIWNELKYKAEVIKEYGKLPLLRCYPQQLNQVFMNFLVNAAHAIKEKGTIKIQTWSDNDNIYIAVSDNGEGIAPENITRLFDAFFTTKEIGKGTGLGLSIAYDIIKKHNGIIDVKSQLGEGATFTVTLPVAGIA